MIAGDIVRLCPEACRRYSWAPESRFEILPPGKNQHKDARRCVVLSTVGRRILRPNGVAEHVTFPVAALLVCGRMPDEASP